MSAPKNSNTGPAPSSAGEPTEYQTGKGCLLLGLMAAVSIAILVGLILAFSRGG